jgi:predicted Rossmann fold nucleotide-binding protein DprA/Smf involved in DNA uptake
MDMGELEGFMQQEEIMAFTEAFLALEQASENKGRQARNMEIALNLLRENIPLETIARTTGLPIEQIQQLQSQAGKN